MLTALLKQALSDNHKALSDQQAILVSDYLSLLNKWNKTHNLTAITSPKEQVYKHIIDSLSVASEIHGENIIDVGTGPGLPGIPLSIFLPNKKFVLVDCILKRVNFLQHVIRSLGLTNAQAFHQRVEKAKPASFGAEFAQGFDTVISRAFSSIKSFIETSGHLLAQDGVILAMKGAYPADELAEIPQDFCIETVRELSVVGLGAQRHCVCIKKTAQP